MSDGNSALFMIVLDLLMILYTYWFMTLGKASGALKTAISLAMIAWLIVLHLTFSNKLLFPAGINGFLFLGIIVLFVGIVGCALLLPKAPRTFFLDLPQELLLLPQGIRVFYGAGFLMQAAVGGLPLVFGVMDGYTHITAGFLGLIGAVVALKQERYRNKVLWCCNLFGLIDILVVASSISLFLLPDITSNHSMMYAVFLPAPLWMWYHFISIGKLIANRNAPASDSTPSIQRAIYN